MQTKQNRSFKDPIYHSAAAATLGALLWLLLTLLPLREANGQGTVFFSNRGVTTTHVWGPSATAPWLVLSGLGVNDVPAGTTPFAASAMALIGAGGTGGHYGSATTFAQLIGAVGAGQPLDTLVPVGQTTTFRSDSSAGIIALITDTLSAVAPYTNIIPADAPAATFAIVAWDNSSGAFPTWAQASVAWMSAQILAGMSEPFTVNAIGGSVNTPPYASGGTSFSLYGDRMVPIVVTLPATAVTTNSATLNATEYPGDEPATVRFVWGTTTNYGNIAAPVVGSGTDALPLSAPLTGLTINTTYHFCVSVSSPPYAQFYTTDQSFTTLTLPTAVVIKTGSGYWGAGSSTLSYSGASPAGAHSFILLQSADPTASLSAWTRVATNSSIPGSFPIPPVGTAAPRYYRIKSE